MNSKNGVRFTLDFICISFVKNGVKFTLDIIQFPLFFPQISRFSRLLSVFPYFFQFFQFFFNFFPIFFRFFPRFFTMLLIFCYSHPTLSLIPDYNDNFAKDNHNNKVTLRTARFAYRGQKLLV